MSAPVPADLAERPYDDRAVHAFLQELKGQDLSAAEAPPVDLAALLVGPLVLAALGDDGFYRMRRLQADLGDLLLAAGAESGWIWEDISAALRAVAKESRFRSRRHFDRVMMLREGLFIELGAGPPGLDTVFALGELGDEVTFLQFCARAFYWDPRCQVAVMDVLLEAAVDRVARDARVQTLAEWGWGSVAQAWKQWPEADGERAEALRNEFARVVGERFPETFPLPDPSRRPGPGARWMPPPEVRVEGSRPRDALDYFEPSLPCPACQQPVRYPAPRRAEPAGSATLPYYHRSRLVELDLTPALQVLVPRADSERIEGCPGCEGSGRALDPSLGEASDLSGPCLACCAWSCALSDPHEIGEVLHQLSAAIEAEEAEVPDDDVAVAAVVELLNGARDRHLEVAVKCPGCDTMMPPLPMVPLDDELIVTQGLLPERGR